MPSTMSSTSIHRKSASNADNPSSQKPHKCRSNFDFKEVWVDGLLQAYNVDRLGSKLVELCMIHHSSRTHNRTEDMRDRLETSHHEAQSRLVSNYPEWRGLQTGEAPPCAGNRLKQ